MQTEQDLSADTYPAHRQHHCFSYESSNFIRTVESLSTFKKMPQDTILP